MRKDPKAPSLPRVLAVLTIFCLTTANQPNLELQAVVSVSINEIKQEGVEPAVLREAKGFPC